MDSKKCIFGAVGLVLGLISCARVVVGCNFPRARSPVAICFPSERSISRVSSHKSGLRCDQDPETSETQKNEMLEEEELRKRLPLASDKRYNAHKCEETVRGCLSVWFTERNRHLSVVVVVGASISIRTHSDSRLNVVFRVECWFFLSAVLHFF